MKFVANARTSGRCVIRACSIPGARIYEGRGYRYLACSIVHAEEAERILFEQFARMNEEAEKNML